MTTVRWGNVRAEATVGERVLDVFDALGAPLRTSCRDANCATCAVTVVQGAEHLAPAREREERCLVRYGFGPGVRLGCQIAIAEDAGEVILASAELERDPQPDPRPDQGPDAERNPE